MNNIASAIRRMAQSGSTAGCLVCTVTAVDRQARTIDCTPIDESAPLLGVNLQANQETSLGIVAFPREGSYVIVSLMAETGAGIVIATDDIEALEVSIGQDKSRLLIDEDKLHLQMGQQDTLLLNKDGIVLNGGKLGGMVKLQELQDNLNQLKRYIETMNQAIGPAMSAIGAGTAANGALGAQSYNKAMAAQNIVLKDMENKKITQ